MPSAIMLSGIILSVVMLGADMSYLHAMLKILARTKHSSLFGQTANGDMLKALTKEH